MSKRPTTDSNFGSIVTTPRNQEMMQLLGVGITSGSVTLSRDEFSAIKKLYGYIKESPNKKPAPPEPPLPLSSDAAYPERAKHEDATRKYKAALEAHHNWQDPRAFMQAGADRNAMRHAEIDGLRLLAWIAKFVPVGEDPLKTLVQLASEAGFDVDPADWEWANEDDDLG